MATSVVALLFALTLGFALPSTALAWDDCPRGELDCAYPGDCSRYVDTNGDGTCDHSQSEPTALTTVTTVDTSTGSDSGEAAAETAALVATASSATTSTTISSPGGSGGTSFLTHYYISPIAVGFFLVYAVSFVLHKTKRMRVTTHRKIWNVLLLATFLITGVFGLILAIQLDYDLPFEMPINLLFWHVEAGIVMTLISLFHLGWHFNYYRNLLRTGRSRARAARAAERASSPRGVDGRQAAFVPERVQSAESRRPVWEVRE